MTTNAKPFLKWAGGKTQLLHDIEHRFPFQKNDKFVYVEPFVGSGAVLFWVLRNFPGLKHAVINDINSDLTNVYTTIKTNVGRLISILNTWEGEYHAIAGEQAVKKEYYYAKRTLFNKRKSSGVLQAALFIFLNRTCFNGLYRVNRKNEFNVPAGSYKKPTICNELNLRAVHQALRKVKILNKDFEHTVKYAKGNAVFYFDPPYKPLSDTSSFTSYARDEFGDDEQIRLKVFCDELNSKNIRWILSNSDVKGKNPDDTFFDDLFEEYQISRVMAKRRINVDPHKRGLLTELLIANSSRCV